MGLLLLQKNMSPLVGCQGRGDFCPGVLLSGKSFARGDFFPGGLLPGATFGRGDFWPGGFLSGGAFVRGVFARGDFCQGGLMPVPPKFNAYTHRLGFLCLVS